MTPYEKIKKRFTAHGKRDIRELGASQEGTWFFYIWMYGSDRVFARKRCATESNPKLLSLRHID
jgi:hypothetical protein